jgi:hypothetical protein
MLRALRRLVPPAWSPTSRPGRLPGAIDAQAKCCNDCDDQQRPGCCPIARHPRLFDTVDLWVPVEASYGAFTASDNCKRIKS